MNIFYHLNRCFSCRFDVKLLNHPSVEKTTDAQFDLVDATPAITNPGNGAVTIANPNSAVCEIFHLDGFLKQYNKYAFTNGINPCDYLVTVKEKSLLFVELTESNDVNNLQKAIKNKKTGNIIFPGGKNEKAQKQLESSVGLFMKDQCFQQAASAFSKKTCIFGYKIRTSGSKSEVSKSINRLLDDIKDKKEQNLIETVSLRAMQKARYSTVNIGHYGLAFDFYTHFTSPIRRFPDMMVHRLLTRYLAGGRTAQKDKYEDLCDHSSEMEQIASNAERASVKYKQVEFMSERVGLEFEGVISGVTEWGLYVEINENKCEGMVPMRDLGDDYYDFDEKNYCLIGRRHHKKFSLGDPVTIKVARANLEKKQLDFALVEK